MATQAPPPQSLAQRSAAKDLSPVAKARETFAALLDSKKKEFAIALGNTMTPEFFTRLILSAANKTPALLECMKTPKGVASVYECAMTCAQLRLTPNTPMGEAYLIPFRTKDGYVCELVIGHIGYNKMAMRSGDLAGILAEAVCEGDEFIYDRPRGEIVKHDISGRVFDDRGNPIVVGAWARAKFRDGALSIPVVLSPGELDRVRAFVAKKSGGRHHYSQDYPDRWAQNSVTKRLVRTKLPLNEQMALAASVDAEIRDDLGAVGGDIFDVQAEPTTTEPDGAEVNTYTGEIVDADGPPDDEPPPPPDPRDARDAYKPRAANAPTPAGEIPNAQAKAPSLRIQAMQAAQKKKLSGQKLVDELGSALGLEVNALLNNPELTEDDYARIIKHLS